MSARASLPRAYWYLWAGALVNRLGGFVFTFLTLYLTSERHFTVERAGLYASLWGAGALLAGPVGGVLADRIGRRRAMLLAFSLSAAAMLQLGLARATWHIALSALVLGFCNDLFRPAMQACVTDLVAPAQRTRAFGSLYWAVNIGFAGAALLGGVLAGQSFLLLFALDAATTLAFGVIVFLRVPETRPPRTPQPAGQPPERAGLARPFGDRVFLTFVALQFLTGLIFQQGGVTLPLEMKAHGVSSQLYGTLIALNGILIIVLQPLSLRIIERRRRAVMLAAGAALTGLGFSLSAVLHTPPGYAVGIAVWTLGEIAFIPIGPTVVADLAPPELRGSYQGVYQIAFGAAAMVAPMLGAFVLGRAGSYGLWGGCLGLGLITAALHLAVAPARRRHLVTVHASESGAAREDGVLAVTTLPPPA